MMQLKNKKAFTMLELTFVVVIIGILSAVAIPKFVATRGDAVMAKAKSTLSSVRSAIATERQKRILRGNFALISSLSVTPGAAANRTVFDGFDGNVANPVLEYPLTACATTTTPSCWYETDGGAGTVANPTVITFNLPTTGSVGFNLINNRLNCQVPNNQFCIELTQ